ncbi:MAG: hypothetical protein ACRDS0_36015 [Pseudonocardiaceae bacterium]
MLVTIALGALTPVVSAPAVADPIGGVIIIPGTGDELSPIRMRTSSGCPTKATKYYATMRGQGFPPDGQIITSDTAAGISTSAGFDVYFERIMRDYAADNHTTLAGRYDITVYCIDGSTRESHREFTGSMEFTSPTAYQAIGTARPPMPPPPALPMMGDDPVVEPPAASPPTAAASAHDQLASQRGDGTAHGVPWLVVALLAVVVVALVAALIARQVRRRRTL